MSEDLKQAIPEAKKPSVIMPIVGIVMAVSLAGMSFFAAPILIDLLKENSTQFNDVANDLDDNMLLGAMGVMIWFTTFSILMTVVAAAAGGNTVIDEEQRTLHPRLDQMTPRKAKQYEAKIQKQRQKKIRELKKMRERQEAQRRRGG